MAVLNAQGGGRAAPLVAKRQLSDKDRKAAHLKAQHIRNAGHGMAPLTPAVKEARKQKQEHKHVVALQTREEGQLLKAMREEERASRRDEVHRRHEEEVYKMRRRKRLQEIRNRQKRGEFISDEQIKMMLDNFDYDYLEDTNFQLQDEQDAIDFLERLERIERADGQAAGDEEVLLASAEGELIDIHIVDDENEGGVEVQTTPSERVGEVEEEQVQGSVADETEEDPALEDEVSVIENLDLVSAVVPSTTTTGPLTAADKDQSSGQR